MVHDNCNEHYGHFQLRNLPPWRRTAIEITQHWTFVGFINTAILFAAGQLAYPYVLYPGFLLDSAIDNNRFNAKLTINVASDIIVLVIFLFEAIFKLLAFGSGLEWRNMFRSKASDQEQDDSDQDLESEFRSYVDKLRPDEEAAIREIFELFDVDHSGSMNQVELRLAMRGLGFDESFESLKRLFEEIDSDGNQEIDFNEFKEVISVRKGGKGWRNARCAFIFARLRSCPNARNAPCVQFMAAKIFAQRPPPGYFQQRWNRFDFFALVVSAAVLPMQFFLPDAKRVGDIARLIRLARLWAVLQVPTAQNG